MKECKALILICDSTWMIEDALIMSDRLIVIEPGMIGSTFKDVVQGGNQADLEFFMDRLRNGAAVSGVELQLLCQGDVTLMQFFGYEVDDRFVIGAGKGLENMLALCVDTATRADIERETLIHKFLMTFLNQPSVTSVDAHILDDISRLNNDIINTNRELAKRNFELFLEKEQNRVTIASIGEAVVATDARGKITVMNAMAEQLTGWSRQDVLGMDVAEVVRFVQGTDHIPLHHLFSTSLAESVRSTLPANAMLVRRDGVILPVDDSIAPIKDESGETNGLVITFRDVTESKRLEKALAQANAKLGILNSITRHDILNQMTMLTGFLELCKRREKNPELVSYLDRMSRAASTVQRQISFTKDYQDMGVKTPTWIPIGRQTAEAFAMLHLPGMILDDRTDGVEILADQLAEKVPYNLIDNSVRHGEHVKHIMMQAEQVGDRMLIVYQDDGKGIEAEIKEHIFENGFGKNTGLGLFLTREILSITDITIVENGRTDQGARFEIQVPSGGWRRSLSHMIDDPLNHIDI